MHSLWTKAERNGFLHLVFWPSIFNIVLSADMSKLMCILLEAYKISRCVYFEQRDIFELELHYLFSVVVFAFHCILPNAEQVRECH
jgi:hypothetical protein